MKKELFFEEIRKWVTEYYGEKAKVSLHEVSKNNNSKKHGLCVTYSTSNCGPTVYLEAFYEEYERGKTMTEVFEEILSIIDGHAVHEKVDLSFFCDFENVRPNICFRLISATKNKEMLEEMPHRLISDLAVVYFVSLSDRGIIQIDERAERPRLRKLLRRHCVCGQDNLLPGEAARLCQRQLCGGRTVQSASLLLQDPENCRIRQRFYRKIFPE